MELAEAANQLERRVVIDSLEDRDVLTCTNWLKRHPEVEMISRDRCGLSPRLHGKGHAISPVIAAALCIKPRGKRTLDQARKVDALKTGSPAFAPMRCLAMRFNGILRGREADPLSAWIRDAIETGLAPIVRFARTLHRDFDAGQNALGMPSQRPSRRSDQPPADPQTRHVRPSQLFVVMPKASPLRPKNFATHPRARVKDVANDVSLIIARASGRRGQWRCYCLSALALPKPTLAQAKRC